MFVVDANGRACPEPVLLTKKALRDHREGLRVLVDNEVARENVTRFAQNQGYQVSVETTPEGFALQIVP